MNEIVAKAAAIDGWMFEPELAWLAETARTHEAIIELGSWKGRSTKALGMATPGVVYAVDHWLGSEPERSGPHKEAADLGPDAFFGIFKRNLDPEIRAGKVIPIRCESQQAIPLLETLLRGRGGKADMVFIDAEHSYQSVARDVRNYTPLVRSGGIISGHDYSTAFPDVMRAVHEHVPGWRMGGGSIWYTVKP